MNVQTRILTSNTQGDDVTLLQGNLLEIGASIAPNELAAALFGPSTRKAVLDFQRQNNLPVTGTVDETTAQLLQEKLSSRPTQYRVLGMVRHPNGLPGNGLTVRAFDRDLRREQLLGETRVDERGYYQIVYSGESFARAEKGAADLLVRVFDGQQTLYDPSADKILFNASTAAVVNIDLVNGDTRWQSEYERILAAVVPVLDDVALDALQEDDNARDITFLAGETGFANYQLAHFAVAQKMTTAYQIVPEFFYALLAEDTLLKIGLSGAAGVRFDINLGTERQALFYDIVLLPTETIGAAIKRAIKDQFVPAGLQRQLDAILQQLARYLAQAQAYQNEQRPQLLFRQVERFLAAGKHEQVLGILQQDAFGNLPALLQRLQDAAAFSEPATATAASTTALMSDVLGYDDQIIDQIRTSQKLERPEDVYQLARLNRAEWKTVLQQSTASVKVGDQPLRKELIDLHASALVRKMEKRFPTTAFGAQLERDKTVFPAHRDTLLELLTDNPDFDLATGNIDMLLKKKATATASPAKEAVKATQRVFKIAPTYRQTKALLDGGVHSAASIHAMGETRFIKSFTKAGVFTRAEARTAFRKASDIHTASALLAGELQATANAMRVNALAAVLPAAKLEAVTKDFPNMNSLFQQADYCACQECRTVHSAAAYVVDTLQFLKNRLVVDTTVGPASVKIAKDVLFEQRPDLGDTDLNCDNTNTPLPYIDVVCELLEEAVAPDPGISFNAILVSGIVPAALLTVLQANGLPFNSQAVVYDTDLNGNRIVRDKKVVCKLSPDGGPNNWLIRRLRQTYGTPAALAAAPEYLNQAAYATLAASKVAFKLPFDLFHQETRRYFGQFDVARVDLMRALRTVAGPQNSDIAAEALDLSDEERQLIVTADPVNQKIYWNTGAKPAADVMKVVDTFVTKADLTYADLQNLLDREWINPGATMFIRHLDNTCNLAKKEIQNLDNNALDRLHRFIRLWKATTWSSSALDRVIHAARLGNGLLDDACLVRVQQISQLWTKLGIAVDELCNLYDAIPADGEESRYVQIFLNLPGNGTINDDFRPENVDKNEQDELNVPGSGKKLAAYKAYLALCLGAKAADSDQLVDALGASAILSAANIATVYSLNLLARTLHLTAAELLILKQLTGVDILLSPADTLRFIDKVAKVRAAGVSPADLQYLLIHEADNLNDRIFRDDAITALVVTLQVGYQTAYNDNRSPFDASASADEDKNALKNLLAKLPNFAEVDLSRFQTIVDDAWQDPILTPALFIDQKLSSFVDTTPIKAAQAALAGAVPPKAVERNTLIKSVADALSTYFYTTTKNALLITAVMKTFKLDEEMALVLVQQARVKQPVAVGNRTLLDLLTDDALIDKVNTPPVPPAIMPGAFDNQYRTLRLLHKMSQLLATVKLPAEQVQWMLQNNAALGWLELDKLMYQAGITPVTFGEWEQLQDTLTLIYSYPPVDNPSDVAHPFTVYGLFDLVLAPATIIK